jgi:hypothetical protein
MIRLRLAVLLIGLPALAGQGTPGSSEPQSAKIWVGHYQEIEDYLRTAECVNMQVLAPYWAARCTLRPGGPVARMAWRASTQGPYRGFKGNYQTEIAAYELDKLLKLDMVPPTVERQLQGASGAAQLWVENIVDGTDTTSPGENRAHWEREQIRMVMFDNLIGNAERNLRNILRDGKWNAILIDHSRAFGTGTILPQRLSRIDRGVWARMESLTRKELDTALGAWLDRDEIAAILDRREKMKAEIKLLSK